MMVSAAVMISPSSAFVMPVLRGAGETALTIFEKCNAPGRAFVLLPLSSWRHAARAYWLHSSSLSRFENVHPQLAAAGFFVFITDCRGRQSGVCYIQKPQSKAT